MNAPANILPNWRTMEPAERDRLLILYCDRGLTASQTARKFADASRSAIIGRVHRLQKAGQKIAFGYAPTGQGRDDGRPHYSTAKKKLAKEPRKPKAPSAPRGRKLRLIAGVEQFQIGSGPKAKSQYDFKTRVEQRASAPPIVIRRENAFDPLPGQEPVPYGSPGCKWSVDGVDGPGLLWCGASKEHERSYCEAHRHLSYQPPTHRLSVPKGA
jgi:hypothetical protein